jgi:hypothetical protein
MGQSARVVALVLTPPRPDIDCRPDPIPLVWTDRAVPFHSINTKERAPNHGSKGDYLR